MHDREFRRFWKLSDTFWDFKIQLNWLNLFYSILKSIESIFESISFSCIWINWIILKWLNLFETIFKLIDYKVPRTTTIFKLIGPCKILWWSKKLDVIVMQYKVEFCSIELSFALNYYQTRHMVVVVNVSWCQACKNKTENAFQI